MTRAPTREASGRRLLYIMDAPRGIVQIRLTLRESGENTAVVCHVLLGFAFVFFRILKKETFSL